MTTRSLLAIGISFRFGDWVFDLVCKGFLSARVQMPNYAEGKTGFGKKTEGLICGLDSCLTYYHIRHS
jgi:hypothetical protein